MLTLGLDPGGSVNAGVTIPGSCCHSTTKVAISRTTSGIEVTNTCTTPEIRTPT